MRIERLERDNQRTQGAARRGWYAQHSPEHLREVGALVEAALKLRGVRGDRQARAVALGAGACTELPLERLAGACGSVLLVDVDVAGMARARDGLPERLRGGVNLVAADLTGGVSAGLRELLRGQPWRDLAALGGGQGMAPIEAAASCLERCVVPDPPELRELELHGYDVVVSDLVLTQLYSLPLLDLVDTLTLEAPGVVERREESARYRAAALGLRRRVALAHLTLLERLLAPGGVGVLLTDVMGYLLPPRGGAHRAGQAGPEGYETLGREVLALPEELAERFTVVGELRRWRWLVDAPTAEQPGRAYVCAGALLRA